jgi:hypothetical protein
VSLLVWLRRFLFGGRGHAEAKAMNRKAVKCSDRSKQKEEPMHHMSKLVVASLALLTATEE